MQYQETHHADPQLAHDSPSSQRRRRHRPRRSSSAARRCSTRRSPSSGLVPPAHKIATRAIKKGEPVKRYNQIIGFASAATSRPASTCISTTSSMGTFDRDYAFGADVKPTQYVDAAGDVHGHRPRGRHASPLATTSASCRRSTARRPCRAASPMHFTRDAPGGTFPNVDGVVALTHGSGCGMDTHGEGMQAACGARWAGTRGTRTSPAC